MDRIRDLTDTDGRTDDAVTSTSGGLFDTQYLSGEPPIAALEPAEQPQYVLRNKKSGIERTGGASETTHSPDSEYQALAVVTDCRVHFFVGHADGDHIEAVDHDEIVEARAENSGLMTSTLLVERVDGQCFRFPCRGDVSAVATYVDNAAQTWATASRLVDEASERIEASRASLDEHEFADARDVLADVSEDVEYALDHVSRVGDGAATELESRANRLIERLHRLEGEIAATNGAHHHAAAQEAWKTDHDFERAAREYERGAEEYERALAAAGDIPPEEAVQRRLKGLLRERAILRAAPMADARAAREVAMATDDPDEAATEWETALTCYREAATLDWGEHDGEFFVERERARERAGEAATEALDAHIEAGQEWVGAGDKIVRNGRRREATQAYQRADDHLTAARDIARELHPSRLDDIDERLAALEKRKAGEGVPPAEPDQPALAVDAVADKLTGRDETTTAATTETAETGDSPPTPVIRRVGTEEGVPDSETATETPSERLGESAEHTPAIRKRSTPGAAHSPSESGQAVAGPGGSGQTDTEDTPGTAQPPVTERQTRIDPEDGPGATTARPERSNSNQAGEPTVDSQAETPRADEDTVPAAAPGAELVPAVKRLDETALTELVAELWEARGWSATIFSAQTDAVYDILAIRSRDDGDERLLLWAAHEPGGTVDATVVRRCATTRDSSRGADAATLVTTGRLTTAARRAAEDHDVTVVDLETLVADLDAKGLGDRLRE